MDDVKDIKSLPIAVCGLGKLGSHLACALSNKGFSVRALASSKPEKAERIGKLLSSAPHLVRFPEEAIKEVQILFLTYPDKILQEMAERLLPLPLSGKTIVHCSGAYSYSLLDCLKAKGATLASFHPLQTFIIPEFEKSNNLFKGISIRIDAEEKALSTLRSIAEALEAFPFELSSGENTHAFYHTAAVLVSNGVVALTEAASKLLEQSGIQPSQAQQILKPLLQQTLHNLGKYPIDKVLTGPIARGDTQTIQQHLRSLGTSDDLRGIKSLYAAIAFQLLELTQKKSFDSSAHNRLIWDIMKPHLKDLADFS